jgi:type IV secretion system protein VirB5
MFMKAWMGLVLMGLLSVSVVRPAHAQFAVIDVASIVQLVQEVQELQQQVATAQSQLQQAQSEYAAITGNRGMQNLLSGTTRNYLPTDWAQLAQVLSGSSSSFPTLAASVSGLVSTNAILTPGQVAALSGSEQAQLNAARQNPALLAATARAALANASNRFATLQELISAIGSATDQKASLDLTARISAEQAMLQNEATKLQMLYQVAQSQEWARVESARERAIADQGSLRTLPPMGL